MEMDTLETMDEPVVEAKLLDTLAQLNDRQLRIVTHKGRKRRGQPHRQTSSWVIKNRPTLAEWLKETGFHDIAENRWTYYGIMGELIQQGLITVHTDSYGTAVYWHRYSLNNAGHDRLNSYRLQKAI